MTARFTLGLLLTLALSLALLGQNAQEIYQRGLVQEQAAGNLQEAIKLYSQAAKSAGKDRVLGANALMKIAGSREKLGQQTEAAETYTELLRTYPEQREQAQQAEQRLAALRKTPPTTHAAQSPEAAAVTPILSSYCTQCHNPDNKTAGLDLTAIYAKNISENTGTWETVLRRLRARLDPPPGSPRPSEPTYRTLIGQLEQRLDSAYPTNGPLQTAERVTDIELAQRMANLLWNAPPDEPLLGEARRGQLRQPAALERQVQRMLRDSKSSAFVAAFFEPMLSFDSLKSAQADSELLRSMEKETRFFLENLIREDRPAIELWTSQITYVNGLLAKHYGIPNVPEGSDFRRTVWPNASRAGILGQAGPLTALSAADRTSPTRRGIFVLKYFLGVDPPNPPANVPPLREAQGPNTGTMRDRLAMHATNPRCASCHVIFDPLGLALENFDNVGRYRTTDSGITVDASGAFADASRFNGPAELRAGLLKYKDAYYNSITQRLLAHALNRKGRGSRIYDYEMPSVRAIVRSAADNDYKWSAIITGIIASPPFQMKALVP